jgi:hypothetical protein
MVAITSEPKAEAVRQALEERRQRLVNWYAAIVPGR